MIPVYCDLCGMLLEGDPYEYAVGESVMWSRCEVCKLREQLKDTERREETHVGEEYLEDKSNV